MKLEPLAHVKNSNRLKMIITTEQLKKLAEQIILEEKQGTIKKTYLVKQTNNNVKKK
jgi:hypothetical protein